MRNLINKYSSKCRKCGVEIPIGKEVIYEKRVGIFCLTCAPTDTEEIIKYRQEGADRKVDRLEEWAEKREVKANEKLNSYPTVRHDWAFITQPGRIPLRDKISKSDDRAYESLEIAKKFRTRAEHLRHVRVAGDAEIERQAKRDQVKSWLKIGMEVNTIIYGRQTIKKINKKTATFYGRTGNDFTCDLSFLEP